MKNGAGAPRTGARKPGAVKKATAQGRAVSEESEFDDLALAGIVWVINSIRGKDAFAVIVPRPRENWWPFFAPVPALAQ